MIRRRRLAALLAVLALFGAGLLLASCGGDDEASDTTTTESTTTSDTTPTSETTTTTTDTSPAGPTEIRIVVVDGVPQGGIVRESVDQGERVLLIVRSDVADEAHLHGYDVSRDVAPGRPARLSFRATIPGRFEVELENLGVQIADISVEP